MATVTKGKTFTNGELVTPEKLHQLVDSATVTNITSADIADSALTTAKIANSAITNAKILNGTIVNDNISPSAAIADTKLATISTAGKVSNSATTATSANTANAIVTRNASGGFNAGTITANLTGNVTGNALTASKLATARTISLTGDVSGSATFDGSANASINAAATHTHAATDITSGTLANGRTTATSANTANAIVARNASGDFSAARIFSSLSISRTGSLIFQDQFGTDFEILGNSTNDKLFIRAGGENILEIDTTSGIPIWKLTSLINNFRIGIGTNAPDPAAKIEISSNSQGFLPPRMTTAQRNAISTPPAGLMLYNTSTNKLQVRTNTAWVDLH